MAGAPQGDIFDVEALTTEELQPWSDVSKDVEVSIDRRGRWKC